MGGIIGGLIIAWILSWLGIDSIIIRGINELFGMEISKAGYYVIFAIIGLITRLLTRRR
ncbi:MAG TPA: hypothetical protein GXZ32_01890 [Clostridiales bacterium]|nr:hypothetical protein [Clostridiales bacterium]